jgi:hypothetical protein
MWIGVWLPARLRDVDVIISISLQVVSNILIVAAIVGTKGLSSDVSRVRYLGSRVIPNVYRVQDRTCPIWSKMTWRLTANESRWISVISHTPISRTASAPAPTGLMRRWVLYRAKHSPCAVIHPVGDREDIQHDPGLPERNVVHLVVSGHPCPASNEDPAVHVERVLGSAWSRAARRIDKGIIVDLPFPRAKDDV